MLKNTKNNPRELGTFIGSINFLGSIVGFGIYTIFEDFANTRLNIFSVEFLENFWSACIILGLHLFPFLLMVNALAIAFLVPKKFQRTKQSMFFFKSFFVSCGILIALFIFFLIIIIVLPILWNLL